jgi:penicillin-binding protein 1B
MRRLGPLAAWLAAGLARCPRPRVWWAIPLVVAGIAALGVPAVATYTAVELARFQRGEAQRGVLVYTAGQRLAAGIDVRAADLAGTLARLGYRETRDRPAAAGQFRQTTRAWDIFVHGGPGGGEAAMVRLQLRGDRIARVVRGGAAVEGVQLEPEVLTTIAHRPGEEHRPIRLDEAPRALVDAVLAIEDHRFFEHGGLDTRGVVRAAWTNLWAGRVVQGGSTITQQLVKNRLVGGGRTLARKLSEAWLATTIESRYPKTQILEAYLNEVYLGQRGGLAIRGVGAAARAYFRKEVHQLTVAEAAVLAGLMRAPNSTSPVTSPARARDRRDLVLARMHELGKLDDAAYEQARGEPLVVPLVPAPGQVAPYFADHARQEIERRLPADLLERPGAARVFTTLDVALQRMAERAVAGGLARLEDRYARLRERGGERVEAALVALDPATGHVRALVGGRNYRDTQFNRAVVARRQPGSAFKPFVYAAALTRRERDLPLFTPVSFIEDTPLTMIVDDVLWTPRNYAERYHDVVTVRQALERSLNSATVRIGDRIGFRHVVATARRLGIESRLRPVPALTLGAFEVTPLELARAYLPFANGGMRPGSLTTVARVLDDEGEVALGAGEPRRVLSAAEAYLMTSLLEGVVNRGTGAGIRALGVSGAVAGKTGTSNEGRDAWFVGYTSGLLALVWVGFDSAQPHGLSGAEAALPIWADFMRQAAQLYPAQRFAAPAGVTLALVNPTNGKLANRFCPIVAREVFLTGSEPPPCDEHQAPADQAAEWWQRFQTWLGS